MSTIDKIQQARTEARGRMQDLNRQHQLLGHEIQRVRTEIGEYDSALKVLERFGLSDEPKPVSPDAGVPAIAKPQDVAPKITGKDAIYEIVKEHPNKGLQASVIRKKAKDRFGITIDPKSASNYLWRLGQETKLRREGHRWFLASDEGAITSDVSHGANVPVGTPEATVSEPPHESGPPTTADGPEQERG